MLPSRQITSINFADTFAHSLFSITDRVKNPADLSVEAFVTQAPIPDGYSCGFAALTGYAGAALRFLQAIEPTHCFSLIDKPMKTRGCGRSFRPFIVFRSRLAGWPSKIRNGRGTRIHTTEPRKRRPSLPELELRSWFSLPLTDEPPITPERASLKS
jgi:hypothetical protein